MDKLKIFNVKWTSQSAGPSLDNNKRTEVFLAGCKKAREGRACKGCFNKELWSQDVYYGLCTPVEAFENIKKYAPNKYITFVGGEPLDQIKPLAELCRLLKNDGFHIILITHYKVSELHSYEHLDAVSKIVLLHTVDVIIDGEYDETQRIWDEEKAGDGLHDVIGSGNQLIWDFHRSRMGEPLEPIAAGDLEGLCMNTKENLVFITKDTAKTAENIQEEIA